MADMTMVGLDTAEAAIAYACEANLLDAGIVADFESRDPTAARSIAASRRSTW